jgi:hypothetical protein
VVYFTPTGLLMEGDYAHCSCLTGPWVDDDGDFPPIAARLLVVKVVILANKSIKHSFACALDPIFFVEWHDGACGWCPTPQNGPQVGITERPNNYVI